MQPQPCSRSPFFTHDLKTELLIPSLIWLGGFLGLLHVVRMQAVRCMRSDGCSMRYVGTVLLDLSVRV